jgi:hypothetical protein
MLAEVRLTVDRQQVIATDNPIISSSAVVSVTSAVCADPRLMHGLAAAGWCCAGLAVHFVEDGEDLRDLDAGA